MPAATRLLSAQLGTQLFRDQVVFVPELSNPFIGNASQDRASWSAPIRGQNGLPDDENGQPLRFLLLQYFLGCGGPPQTTQSGRG